MEASVMMITVRDGVLVGKNAVAIRPGKIDRSPTRTGCSALMAILNAKGQMKVGDRFIAISLIDTEFDCKIGSAVDVSGTPGIFPSFQDWTGLLERAS